jgi:hypothetical protein
MIPSVPSVPLAAFLVCVCGSAHALLFPPPSGALKIMSTVANLPASSVLLSNEMFGNSIQTMLETNYMGYTFRKALYTIVLDKSQFFKEIQLLDDYHTVDYVYFGIFIGTLYMFIRDIKYREILHRLMSKNMISKRTVRIAEFAIFFLVMVLFQDVDVATG